MAKKFNCDFCHKQTNELFEIEVHLPFFTTYYSKNYLCCKKCLPELEHIEDEYIILGKVG